MKISKIPLEAIVVSLGLLASSQVLADHDEDIDIDASPPPIEYTKGRVGVYIDFILSSKVGNGIRNPHPELIIGKEKAGLHGFSLGHGGEVIVGNTYGLKKKEFVNCFKNNPDGPDILVHEMDDAENRPETFYLYIATDRAATQWYRLEGKKSIKDGLKNWVPFEMGEIKSGYLIKVADANDQMVKIVNWTGVDPSAVYLVKPCGLLLS